MVEFNHRETLEFVVGRQLALEVVSTSVAVLCRFLSVDLNL